MDGIFVEFDIEIGKLDALFDSKLRIDFHHGIRGSLAKRAAAAYLSLQSGAGNFGEGRDRLFGSRSNTRKRCRGDCAQPIGLGIDFFSNFRRQ